MNTKPITSFLWSLIISAIIYFAIIFLLSISLFTFQAQPYRDIEFSDSITFYFTLSLFILSVIFIFRQFKAGRKFVSLGVIVSTLMLLFALFIFGSNYFMSVFYKEKFNAEKWSTSKEKPFHMAKTIFKENKLVGLSRKKIIEKLGYDRETAWTHGNALLYTVEKGWILTFDLQEDTVVKIDLIERGLDL